MQRIRSVDARGAHQYRGPGHWMERSGRSRGRAFRRGAIGTFFLLAQAGCGSAGPHVTGTTAPRAPSFGQTVRLAPVGGRVRVSLPGSAFVRLTRTRIVPVGTLVDTNAGAVALTVATPRAARLQTGRFHGGVFEIRQSPTENGLTNLVIRDNETRSKACATVTPRLLGLLRGDATGRFRTTGRFAAGTVRGTEWGVRDRCDGTLVVVTRGTVDVRDFRLGKNVLVHAGHTYLATAR
jgi:hypothetical protein